MKKKVLKVILILFVITTICKENEIVVDASNYLNKDTIKAKIQNSVSYIGDSVNYRLSASNNDGDTYSYIVFCLEKGDFMNWVGVDYKYDSTIIGKTACAANGFLPEEDISKFKAGKRTRFLINPGDNKFVRIQKKLWEYIKNKNYPQSCSIPIFGFQNTQVTLKEKDGFYRAKIKLNAETINQINEIIVSVEKYKSYILKSKTSNEIDVSIPKEVVGSDLNFKITIKSNYGDVIIPKLDKYIAPYSYLQNVGVLYFEKHKERDLTSTIDVKIEKELSDCDKDLNASDRRNVTLVELYKKYADKGKEYNGLLNFENPQCTFKPKKEKIENDCMEANNSIDDFSKDDVSNFGSVYDINGTEKAFCKTYFKLEKNENYNESDTDVKSGMLIFSSVDGDIMKATIIEKCFAFSPKDRFVFPNRDLNKIISDVKLENTLFISEKLKDEIISSELVNNVHEYTREIEIAYKLPNVFAINGSGRIVYPNEYDSKCLIKDGDETHNICEKIGQGIPTWFTNNEERDMEFSYMFNENKYSATCPINLNREIVTCNEDDECKLNLEFRTIEAFSLSQDFRKKNGDSRTPGKNWCTSVGGRVLNIRNNSDNKQKSEPLYTIELTSSKIKEIREYNKNKENSYDDPLYCDEEGVCQSKFLKEKFPTLKRKKVEWEDKYNEVLIGDVNLDGKINVYDRTEIQLYILKRKSTSCLSFTKELADVNLDNVIDENDDYLIGQYMGFNVQGSVGQAKYKLNEILSK